MPNFKDSVRDHDHMTGKYRGAAHNECNFKLKLNPKTTPIPVIFHNLKGYDGHLLMQAMARVQGEIKCIPTNTEKYISFSQENLRFIDSVNFLLSSLDKLVKGSDEFPIMKKLMPEENKRQLLLKKQIYPYEYMDSFERLHETQLLEKEKFYSSLCGKGITDEEYEHAKKVWELDIRMPKSWRLSRPLRGDRHAAFSRRVREFQKGLPREIRAGSSALLQRARFELGRTLEEDRSRAGAADELGHALVHRAWDEGRHLNGKQALRKSEQPAGRRIRPGPTNKLHHIS